MQHPDLLRQPKSSRVAVLALGCDRVYTEDLNYGQTVEGLAIVNPFR